MFCDFPYDKTLFVSIVGDFSYRKVGKSIMWVFYVLSLIPVAIGAILWLKNDEIVWWEWLVGSAVGFVVAALFHLIAFKGMTHDVETWSGQISKVVHYPRWVEREDHTITDYDSKGKACGSHTETTYTTHSEHWTAYSNIGTERDIEESFFYQAARKFGNHIRDEYELKSGFDSGDHDIYPCDNETGYCYPINDTKSFDNRIKAAPTLFSFTAPPKSSPAFDYPKNNSWFASDRLLGTAKSNIDLLAWDRMNARLGPSKKVNVIMVGFSGDVGENVGVEQQAKWIGGKKNDLVITYGGGSKTTNPSWVYVFGWTEAELVKQDIQSIMLQKPVNNNLIPLIEQEIQTNYVKKNWHKFDYIKIDPPAWSYWVFILIMAATQIGYYIWACNNDCEKHSFIGRFRSYGGRY